MHQYVCEARASAVLFCGQLCRLTTCIACAALLVRPRCPPRCHVLQVTRCRLMEAYAEAWPQYGFQENFGHLSYPHRKALLVWMSLWQSDTLCTASDALLGAAPPATCLSCSIATSHATTPWFGRASITFDRTSHVEAFKHHRQQQQRSLGVSWQVARCADS